MQRVSWRKVCHPRSHGGLRIRDISICNEALLGKWMWGLCGEGDYIWRDVLISKYGSCRNLVESSSNRVTFIWWRDIKKVCDTIIYNIYFLFMFFLSFKCLWNVSHSLFIYLVCVWAEFHPCRWGSTRSSWWCWRRGLSLCLLYFIFSLFWDCKAPTSCDIGDWFIILCLFF